MIRQVLVPIIKRLDSGIGLVNEPLNHRAAVGLLSLSYPKSLRLSLVWFAFIDPTRRSFFALSRSSGISNPSACICANFYIKSLLQFGHVLLEYFTIHLSIHQA